jgi:hypothetical protein
MARKWHGQMESIQEISVRREDGQSRRKAQ